MRYERFFIACHQTKSSPKRSSLAWQLAKDLGTTREATGRRLNQHTIWDSNELDIVGKALGLTDMFGLCDYARALAEMNKNVPLSKTV